MPSSQVEKPATLCASAPHGDRQALARREANGPDDVVGACGTHDHRRVLVDGAVPDVACLLVLTVAGPHERTGESPLELVDGRVAEHLCHVVLFRSRGQDGIVTAPALRALCRAR